jgi:hypothetical protein
VQAHFNEVKVYSKNNDIKFDDCNAKMFLFIKQVREMKIMRQLFNYNNFISRVISI